MTNAMPSLRERFLCDCETGMRGGESVEWAPDVVRKWLTAHEAGHAVVGYAVGAGCSEISIMVTAEECHGHVIANLALAPRVRALMISGRLDKAVLAQGVMIAAGPAAARAFCVLAGQPINNFGNSYDDAAIAFVAAILDESRLAGRRRYSYRAMVWRRAQIAMLDATIANAVGDLATELNRNYWPQPPAVAGSESVAVMPGKTARAIMRNAGVKPGYLAFDARLRLRIGGQVVALGRAS